jgi:hypothetical protein
MGLGIRLKKILKLIVMAKLFITEEAKVRLNVC